MCSQTSVCYRQHLLFLTKVHLPWSRTRGAPMSGSRIKPRSGSSSLVGCARHVLDGDASLGARALQLGEVHPKLLCLLLGRLRGIGLFLPASPGSDLRLLSGL